VEVVERRAFACLCLALVALQAFDLHSTLRAAAAGRSETNPLILWASAHLGFVPAVVALKTLAIAVIALYYLVVGRFQRTGLPAMSLVPVCAVYIAVVVNNYS
jgi:hypothetical protein